MARVIITSRLREEILKKFKQTSVEIFSLLLRLEEHPQKGKPIATIGSIAIKEMKFQKFRFYFITDAYKIKFLKPEELQDLLIKFIRMSEKKDQEKVIQEIKHIVKLLGREAFEE